MATINARSPYVVTINETGQIETKLQIFLWNGTGSMPSSPAYTLSKKIPSSNKPATYYDVSPYVREYIDHNTLQVIDTVFTNTPTSQWCNIGLKLFKKVSTSFTQVGSTQTHFGVDGYGYYEEGYNPALENYLLTEGTYTYSYNLTGEYGWLTLYTGSGNSVKYTNLQTGATYTTGVGTNVWRDIPRVYPSYASAGNLLEIVNGSGVVLFSSTFLPKEECKYEPVQVDFVNKFGAWQREYFFKASFDSLAVENTEYNLMPSTYPNYSQYEGQRAVFNANGKKSIRVNTDWVSESYKEVISQLMLSEKILINEKQPAKLNTKNTELFKSINTKLINYQLEFEFAYDVINSVV
jgi:hypothetical protein